MLFIDEPMESLPENVCFRVRQLTDPRIVKRTYSAHRRSMAGCGTSHSSTQILLTLSTEHHAQTLTFGCLVIARYKLAAPASCSPYAKIRL